MTAAYTTDLTDITLAESTTGWTALGGGASGLATNADSSMQGTFGIGKQISAAEKGQVYGSGGTTIAAGRHVFIWAFLTTPGLSAVLASRGLTAVIGSSTTAYCQYHVEGNDTYGASGRVGKCYPIDPSVRSSNPGSSPYRTVTGSPTGTFAQFGAIANITGTVKGENLVVDAIRHGTAVYCTGGSIGSPSPANFDDLSFVNDANDATNGYNRWGIFSAIGGAFELQGKVYIGVNNSGTPTACTFVDANKTIFILENPHVASTFNGFVYGHDDTSIEWTNITIQSLGATSPGTIARSGTTNPDITFDTCNFIGLSTIDISGSGTKTITGCVFRSCDIVSVSTGAVTGCTFINSVGTWALSRSYTAMSDVTGNTFISSGTGHAVYLGTVTASASMDWDNFLSGYALTDGSSGNEAIRVNVQSGQTLTINVAAGADTPSVYNTGTGTVNVVSGSVTATLTVTDADGTPISGANVLVKAAYSGSPDTGLPYNEQVTISNSGTTATVTHYGHGLNSGDKVLIRFLSDTGKVAANEGVFSITKIDVNSYSYTMGSSPGSSPTGTIYSTYVLLSGTTNGLGQISATRSFPADQPVSGWARKSSSAPYYKTGAVNGTVDSGTGATLSAVLVADD